MAAVTLVALTRADKDYVGACSSSASGSATEGQVDIVYDDTESQEQIVRALEKAIAFITANVAVRQAN